MESHDDQNNHGIVEEENVQPRLDQVSEPTSLIPTLMILPRKRKKTTTLLMENMKRITHKMISCSMHTQLLIESPLNG